MLVVAKLLPVILIPEEFPNVLGIIDKAHHVTYLIEVVLSLKYLGSLLIFLSSILSLFHYLISPLLSLLPPLPLTRNFAFLLLKEILPSFLSCFLFEVSVVMLPLVFFKNEVSPLLGLIHLKADVKLHVVHGHLDYVVSLIYLLDLLLGLVAEIFDLALSSLLGLF